MAIDFQRSIANAFLRSPAQARNQIIAASRFSIVVARINLQGYGTWQSTQSRLPTGFAVPTSAAGTSMSQNSVWPAVYAVCTESWSESGLIGGVTPFTKSQTITSTFTQYNDQSQPQQTSSGSILGGAIVSYTTSSTVITVAYTVNSGSYVGTGTYTLTLSGSLLNPGGSGPFNPTDATYGWAALAAAVNALLASVVTPPVVPSSGSSWVQVFSKSTSPGFTSNGPGYYTGGFFGTFYDYVAAAVNGYPSVSSSAVSNFLNPTICDYLSPYGSGGTTVPNYGQCWSMKSIWQLDGSSWVDPSVITSPPAIVNNHKNAYVQLFDPSNFTTTQPVNSPAVISNPLTYPGTIVFNVADVAANLASGTYGILGFNSTSA